LKIEEAPWNWFNREMVRRTRKEPLMGRVTEEGKIRKSRVLGTMEVLEPEEYEGLSVNGKVELIQQLIPLGLMYVNELLQSEVKELAGDWYAREAAPKERVRHGSNPGSVKLAGQRLRLEVPGCGTAGRIARCR